VAVRVLLIAGLGHSGSTVLGALMGQLDGFFFTGELRSAARAFKRRDPCGCGEPLPECPVWTRILANAFGETDRVKGLRLDDASSRAFAILRQRHVRPSPEAAAFEAVFRAAVETTGSRVVVDSSKWPGYAHFLQHLPGVDLSVLHLIRDPRGVAHSRRKYGARGGQVLGPTASAVQWDLWNPLVEMLWRRGSYARLRYEDFVAEPEDAIRRIAGLVGETPRELPFDGHGSAELAPTHSVVGNRSRFQTGAVRIELDEEWRSHGEANRSVAALTWPVRLRYGYS